MGFQKKKAPERKRKGKLSDWTINGKSSVLKIEDYKKSLKVVSSSCENNFFFFGTFYFLAEDKCERRKGKDNFIFNSFLRISHTSLIVARQTFFIKSSNEARASFIFRRWNSKPLPSNLSFNSFFMAFFIHWMPSQHTSQNSVWMFHCHFRFESFP